MIFSAYKINNWIVSSFTYSSLVFCQKDQLDLLDVDRIIDIRCFEYESTVFKNCFEEFYNPKDRNNFCISKYRNFKYHTDCLYSFLSDKIQQLSITDSKINKKIRMSFFCRFFDVFDFIECIFRYFQYYCRKNPENQKLLTEEKFIRSKFGDKFNVFKQMVYYFIPIDDFFIEIYNESMLEDNSQKNDQYAILRRDVCTFIRYFLHHFTLNLCIKEPNFELKQLEKFIIDFHIQHLDIERTFSQKISTQYKSNQLSAEMNFEIPLVHMVTVRVSRCNIDAALCILLASKNNIIVLKLVFNPYEKVKWQIVRICQHLCLKKNELTKIKFLTIDGITIYEMKSIFSALINVRQSFIRVTLRPWGTLDNFYDEKIFNLLDMDVLEIYVRETEIGIERLHKSITENNKSVRIEIHDFNDFMV